jgi:uncharacterized tellurite resistance protein B-like protein
MSLLRFIKSNLGTTVEAPAEIETLRKITTALDQLDEDRARFIAAFAYLLCRVARADMKISPEETREMERIVVERGGLPEEQAIIVVQIAKSQNRLFGGTENYLVAREFKDLSNHQEKLSLLDCLFAVAASHDSISAVEDNEISQIADELRIEHREFISIRSRYRDSLAVLR